MTLAVRRLESSHTGRYIRDVIDHVLTEWDIEPSKIIASLTDNGSNMVAAFRKKVEANVCGQEGEDEEEEEEVTEEDSKAAVDETLDFDCQVMSHQIAFGSLNHVSCFSHSLQLVMNKFSGITAFQPILKRAFWRQSGKKDLRKQQVSHQES